MALLGCHAAAAAPTSAALPAVDAGDLVLLAADHPDLLVIDTRPATARREGYIEGSRRLDHSGGCAALQGATTLPVVFYCQGPQCGDDSAAVQARRCGYQHAWWLRGGFEEWVARGYPFLRE